MRKISKIFLKCDGSLLFSIKRSPRNPRKDNKLELLGGGIDAGETPFQGLIRELYEEEMTGTLARKADMLKLNPVQILVNGDPHYIYEMEIEPNDIQLIRMDDDESRGYRIIDKRRIADAPLCFTPKTIMIFRALGLI